MWVKMLAQAEKVPPPPTALRDVLSAEETDGSPLVGKVSQVLTHDPWDDGAARSGSEPVLVSALAIGRFDAP